MTSKNLYFKLMKEDLKSRLWAVSLIGLGFFFLYPVAIAFMAGEIKEYEIYEQGFKWYSVKVTEWLSFGNGLTVFVMMLTALICGLSGFSYLNSKSKVDFYHSIPVKREKLYIANYINGILMVAVPYAICMVLAVFAGISNGVEGGRLWQAAFAAYGMNLTYFILMYSVVVVAVMMTGNLVIAFLGCMVFSFLVPIAVTVSQVYFEAFFHTYVWTTGAEFAENGLRISPVMEYVYQISRYHDGETVWTAALAALLLSAVIAVLGGFLYRKRPSEAAGKAMAFALSGPIIRVLLTLLCSMSMGVFFWSMRESTGWAVFGILCGAVICHCVIEIIYNFDFKKLFADKIQLIGCVLISLAVLFVFRYDLVGYDRYLPSSGDVKSAAVEVSRLNNWVSYGSTKHRVDGSYDWEDQASLSYVADHMKYTDTENLLYIAAEGIDETRKERDSKNRHLESTDSTDIIDREQTGTDSMVTICYTLKSGRRIYRTYTVDLDKIMPQIEKLSGSKEYQEGTYPLMTVQPENVAEIYYSEAQKEIRMDKLTAEQKAIILETYKKEFAAMTPSQMKAEFPLGLIRFSSEMDEAGMKWLDKEKMTGFVDYPRYQYSGDFSNRSYYPIYPSCKETVKLLKEQQIEAGGYYKNMDIQSVSFTWFRDSDNYQVGPNTYESHDAAEIMVTDANEIAQLKQIMKGAGGNYYNNMFATSDVDAEISVLEDGGTQRYRVCLPRGKVPEFVQERLKAIETK